MGFGRNASSLRSSPSLRSGYITRAIRLTPFAQIGSRRLRIARNRYLLIAGRNIYEKNFKLIAFLKEGETGFLDLVKQKATIYISGINKS